MSRRRADRLNHSQRCALESAGEDGRLAFTDLRTVPGLVDRGWVRKVITVKRRKERVHFEITDAGREALATLPIIEAPTRVRWPSYWHRERISQTDHVIEHSHRIYRPGRDSCWSVLCPDLPTGKAAGVAETLTEAVEMLETHLFRTACERRPDVLPVHSFEAAALDALTRGPAPAEPEPVDLDTLTTPAPLRLLAPVPTDADTVPAADPSTGSSPRPALRLVGAARDDDERLDGEHQGDEHLGPVQWDIFGQAHPITAD